MSGFHSMMNRLLRVRLGQTEFEREKELLRGIAVKMDAKRL